MNGVGIGEEEKEEESERGLPWRKEGEGCVRGRRRRMGEKAIHKGKG